MSALPPPRPRWRPMIPDTRMGVLVAAQWGEVRSLRAAGVSIGLLARECGLNRETVLRVLARGVAQCGTWSRVERGCARIRARLAAEKAAREEAARDNFEDS